MQLICKGRTLQVFPNIIFPAELRQRVNEKHPSNIEELMNIF